MNIMIELSEYISSKYSKSFTVTDYPFEIKKRHISKGSHVYEYSKIGRTIYFLNKGVVETTIEFGLVEKTLSFIFEGTFFGAYLSALTNTSSNIQGTALTDCIVEEIPFEAYQNLCKTSLLANQIGKTEIEYYFVQKSQRERDFLTKTTEEMYLDLINKNPQLLNQVPLKKIANYFGILPETLSRIRKKIIS